MGKHFSHFSTAIPVWETRKETWEIDFPDQENTFPVSPRRFLYGKPEKKHGKLIFPIRKTLFPFLHDDSCMGNRKRNTGNSFSRSGKHFSRFSTTIPVWETGKETREIHFPI